MTSSVTAVDSDEVVLGVDTHRDQHTAAVVSVAGVLRGCRQFPATGQGYRDLLCWARGLGVVRRAGVASLEARHRAHARVEDRIKAAKDTGLGRFPSREYAINQAWLQIVAVAADLTAWLRLLALDGDLAAAKPKTLRFQMLYVSASLTRSGRRRRLRLPRHWPWADQIVEAFRRIMIITAPT